MNKTHILTIKSNYNINIHKPRMIVPQNTILEVYEDSAGNIMIPLGGRFSLDLCTTKDGFDDYLKRKLFEIVKVHISRENTDA